MIKVGNGGGATDADLVNATAGVGIDNLLSQALFTAGAGGNVYSTNVGGNSTKMDLWKIDQDKNIVQVNDGLK